MLFAKKVKRFLSLVSDMRRDVQEIYRNTPHGKQVMMFSATLSKEIRPVCKKFMQDVIETTTTSTSLTTNRNFLDIYAPTRIAINARKI